MKEKKHHHSREDVVSCSLLKSGEVSAARTGSPSLTTQRGLWALGMP